MRSLRYTIEMQEGVKVDLLFTPHLFSFKGQQGAAFESGEDNSAIFEAYADILYCAAVNEWVLDGKGTAADAPFRRGDFHEWMIAEPKEFGKAVNFAFEALTGKTLKESINNAEKADDGSQKAEEGSKKKRLSWIGRILRHS